MGTRGSVYAIYGKDENGIHCAIGHGEVGKTETPKKKIDVSEYVTKGLKEPKSESKKSLFGKKSKSNKSKNR